MVRGVLGVPNIEACDEITRGREELVVLGLKNVELVALRHRVRLKVHVRELGSKELHHPIASHQLGDRERERERPRVQPSRIGSKVSSGQAAAKYARAVTYIKALTKQL